jgi:hypothetical protein
MLAWVGVCVCGVIAALGALLVIYTFLWASFTPDREPNQYVPFFILVVCVTGPFAAAAMALLEQLTAKHC